MEINNEEIVNRIKEIAKEKDIKMKDLALQLGVTYTYLYAIFKAKHLPLDFLIKTCHALKITLDNLISYKTLPRFNSDEFDDSSYKHSILTRETKGFFVSNFMINKHLKPLSMSEITLQR